MFYFFEVLVTKYIVHKSGTKLAVLENQKSVLCVYEVLESKCMMLFERDTKKQYLAKDTSKDVH